MFLLFVLCYSIYLQCICLPVCFLSICLSICLLVCLSVCLPVYISVCPYARPSAPLRTRPSIQLFISHVICCYITLNDVINDNYGMLLCHAVSHCCPLLAVLFAFLKFFLNVAGNFLLFAQRHQSGLKSGGSWIRSKKIRFFQAN